MLGLSCSDRGILAGTQRRDPGEAFAVEHVKSLPRGVQFPAPLIERVAEVDDFFPEPGDRFVVACNERVERTGRFPVAQRSVDGPCPVGRLWSASSPKRNAAPKDGGPLSRCPNQS